MRSPKISICLPNLNTARYLPERFESVLAQTFTDWELVVHDSYSDDGAWEYIKHVAASEPRIQISQGPREGVYAGFNACISKARGEFVYIATSDDTMEPDCLEKLLSALQRHPECGVAHCSLQIINGEGKPVQGIWEDWDAVKYFGGLMDQAHVRPIGHDAVIACAFYTPYWSITQLLFRRSLLEKTGLFEGKWASYGDLAWQMRATLNTCTVHIPEKLATWRIHPAQASQLEKAKSDRRKGLFVAMVEEFLVYTHGAAGLSCGGFPKGLRRFMVVKMWLELPWNGLSKSQKVSLLIRRFCREPQSTIHFAQILLWRKFGRNDWEHDELRREISRLGIAKPQVF